MSVYFDALKAAMFMLADDPRTIFLGQAVSSEGTAMSKTFRGITENKLLEMPVAENLQLGMSIGMSLGGYLPISVFPRINFLICAMDALVLHLDKLPLYSGYRPRVIIRTAIATAVPLDPGPQHVGDYSDAIRQMLTTIEVVSLDSADRIVPEYGKAMRREGSTLLVERTELY